MKKLFTPIIAGLTGLLALGAASAIANDRPNTRSDYRPAHCDIDHDHRSHDSNYYDYYAPDRYYRAGAYRGTGVNVSVRYGDRRHDQRHNARNYSRSGQGHHDRVVNRQTFNTRYRARIVLTEKFVQGRRGPRLVCTVKARGPEAHYVSDRRMHRVANQNCSPRARIRVYS